MMRLLLAIAVLGATSSMVLLTALEDRQQQVREFDKLLVCDGTVDVAACNHLRKFIKHPAG